LRERRGGPRQAGEVVRIGLLGCGAWGLNYLRTFAELEGSFMTYVCDTNPDRLREAERRLPSVQTTEDLDAFLGKDDLDAVVVAVDATRHYDMARRVLEAGKDCLLEKPMTTDVGEAIELRNLATRSGRVLMVGHVFRHNAAINYVRQMMAAGEIGDLLYLYFTRTNLGPIRSDVNVSWDLMSHDVSIALHFVNRLPEWVSAQGASYISPGCEDVAFATLGFPGGVVANMRASWLDPRKVREITVVGSRRMVVIDDVSGEPVRVFDKSALLEPSYDTFGEFKLVTRFGDVVIPHIPPVEPLKAQCQHFLDAIQTGTVELSDPEDGVRVVQVITAINESIAQHGAPVRLVENPTAPVEE
jgi:predicted dehydrogenase